MPASEAEIERRILELKNATGDVVVVATIETFQPSYADIQEYAVKMFENRGRGIGAKGKDNGLLVLVAVKDRRVRVEVGYDLEQFVTDGYAGEVSRDDMAPYFARGEYGAGLQAGVTRLIGRIAQGRGVTLTGVPMPAPERGSDIQLEPVGHHRDHHHHHADEQRRAAGDRGCGAAAATGAAAGGAAGTAASDPSAAADVSAAADSAGVLADSAADVQEAVAVEALRW